MLVVWAAGMIALGARAEDLPLRETPQGKLFGTEQFAVRLDPQTGWAGDVFCDGRCVVTGGDSRQFFDLKQDDAWVTGRGAAIEGVGVERIAPATIVSRMKAGDWSVDAFVELFPDKRMLRRWFQITWQGSAQSKIKAFWFQGGRLSLGGNGGYLCPAQYPPQRVGAKELAAGRNAYSGRSPYPVVADSGDGWSALWMADESQDYSDRGSSGVSEGEGFIRVTQSFNVLGRMRRGVPQTVGDAWLWLQPNDAETALRRLGEWFRFVRQTPPADRPEWLKRVILYSFHPGGTIGSQCLDLGGFREATALLPHIRALGCNAVWLMPLEDKSIYWPRDYYKLQEGLGTPADYRELTGKAHALGMRVWQDCVPHGGCNEYPRAKEHPEWLAQNEDGSTLYYWCFDFNWPTWIDYMRGVASFYTREYGLDGFRIDACGGSKIPNWNPAIPYARASHSQAQGGLNMQRAIRQAVKQLRPDGANLAETGASIHGTVSDSTYDFDLCYRVLHDFRDVPAGVFVPRLRRWLHEQQCSEVPDLVRMRHIESHDSLRSGLWYGALPQRALVALVSWIDGIPMVYHEMEDGQFDAFRTIFQVRSQVPELNAGAADYLSVASPHGVFACLRTGTLPKHDSPAWHPDYAWDTAPVTPERASIVLVNLDGRLATGDVSLPAGCLPESLRGAITARDLFSGKSLPVRHEGAARAMHVTLPPFGYTVLRFQSETLPPVAAPRGLSQFSRSENGTAPFRIAQAVSSPPPDSRASLPAAVAPLQLKIGTGTLQIDPATGLASGCLAADNAMSVAMDLALPADLVNAAGKAICREAADGLVATRPFGSRTLRLHYARSDRGGIEVRASWEGGVPDGAAVLFDLPDGVAWQAQTAEGPFASPFRVRHPRFDGLIGSIYRLPQGTAVTWDSRLHPFGLSPAHAWVGAVSAQGARSVFAFDPQRLPACVQVIDRVGPSHGMKVRIAWQDVEDGVSAGGDELRFHWSAAAPAEPSPGSTGDSRLTLAGGGWEFENSHYRVRIARTGALAGLWRKTPDGWRQVLHQAGAYTDKGYAEDVRYAQENDVEAAVRIQRCGSGIRLSACGELRGFERFAKMAHPVHFYTSYLLDDGPAIQYACAVKPESPSAAQFAYLSLMLRTEGVKRVAFADADGVFLRGDRGDGSTRVAQTARSGNPGRLPRDIRLFGDDGLALRLGEMGWIGVKPDNVFLHGNDLHVAWMDGRPHNRGTGRWSGLTCSLACDDTAAARQEPPPLAQRDDAGLLRNGQFQASNAAEVVLLSSGHALPQLARDGDVWRLPPGAAYTVESGNRCLTVEGDGLSYRLVRQMLPTGALEPGTKWRLVARMKGAGIERGDVDWKTACLRWAVSNAGRTTYATASLPWDDTPWNTYEAILTVPDNPESIAVEAGMNGNRGKLWIDDVRIEPADQPSR